MAIRHLFAAVALATSFAAAQPTDGELPTSINGSLTILDLASKVLPFGSDPDDADPKDVKLGPSKYPLADGDGFIPKKRLRMLSKRDGASAARCYDREFGGEFGTDVRVSISDDVERLADGQTVAFFRLEQVDGETPAFLEVAVTWSAALDGFTARATADDGDLGAPADVPGARELELRIEWDSFGRRATVEDLTNRVTPLDVGDARPIPPEAYFKTWFGVRDLPKKGAVWFTNLDLFGRLSINTSGEVAPALQAQLALGFINQAFIAAQMAETMDPQLDFVASLLEFAFPLLDAAAAAMDEADPASFHPTTDRKRVTKSIKRSIKRGKGADKTVTKLGKKTAPKTAPAVKKINKLRWAALVTRAQLFGFRSFSIDKYFDTLIVEVDLL